MITRWFQLHPRTFLTRHAGPPPAKVSRCVRFVSCTLSAVDALTSGCVAAVGAATGEDTRPLTRRRPREPTTSSWNNT